MRRFLRAGPLFIGIMLLDGCAGANPNESALPGGDERAPTVQVTKQDITSVLAVSGSTETNSKLSLTTKGVGRIDWKVKEGQNVQQGTVLAEIDGGEITAPSDGKILSFTVPSGSTARPNFPVGVFEARTLGIKVQVPVEDAYRLYSTPAAAVASIEAGPAAQPCELFLTGFEQSAEVAEQTLPEFVCILEPNVDSMPGLPAKVGIETASSSNALTLPVESVSGSSQNGQVTTVSSTDEKQKRDVRLGISDGNVIEIVEGLKEGDSVLAVSPGIFDE
ncbi:biotin/lipoyl-containing protein [Glutamicibacter arilaitensis]|uniref:biotin/lipoyl-containing protein n=1 Tax=Glutamicibacter arilaitensis TaxID=256701 RepID=UPI003A8DA859